MSLGSIIRKNLVQDAVYWGNPTNKGSGGQTFSAPVAIKCRWEDKNQLFNTGGERLVISSRALVYVDRDVDEQGKLWLGLLADLSEAQKADPDLLEGAAPSIKKFEKIPVLHSTTEFVKVAWLTPLLT